MTKPIEEPEDDRAEPPEGLWIEADGTSEDPGPFRVLLATEPTDEIDAQSATEASWRFVEAIRSRYRAIGRREGRRQMAPTIEALQGIVVELRADLAKAQQANEALDKARGDATYERTRRQWLEVEGHGFPEPPQIDDDPTDDEQQDFAARVVDWARSRGGEVKLRPEQLKQIVWAARFGHDDALDRARQEALDAIPIREFMMQGVAEGRRLAAAWLRGHDPASRYEARDWGMVAAKAIEGDPLTGEPGSLRWADPSVAPPEPNRDPLEDLRKAKHERDEALARAERSAARADLWHRAARKLWREKGNLGRSIQALTAEEPSRPHHLAWNGTEWTDDRCGCRYHPDDNNGKHGGAPHVHRCEQHKYATPSATREDGPDEQVSKNCGLVVLHETEQRLRRDLARMEQAWRVARTDAARMERERDEWRGRCSADDGRADLLSLLTDRALLEVMDAEMEATGEGCSEDVGEEAATRGLIHWNGSNENGSERGALTAKGRAAKADIEVSERSAEQAAPGTWENDGGEDWLRCGGARYRINHAGGSRTGVFVERGMELWPIWEDEIPAIVAVLERHRPAATRPQHGASGQTVGPQRGRLDDAAVAQFVAGPQTMDPATATCSVCSGEGLHPYCQGCGRSELEESGRPMALAYVWTVDPDEHGHRHRLEVRFDAGVERGGAATWPLAVAAALEAAGENGIPLHRVEVKLHPPPSEDDEDPVMGSWVRTSGGFVGRLVAKLDGRYKVERPGTPGAGVIVHDVEPWDPRPGDRVRVVTHEPPTPFPDPPRGTGTIMDAFATRRGLWLVAGTDGGWRCWATEVEPA